MTEVQQSAAGFASPFDVPTPPGAEGWEEMYPYYLLFDRARDARGRARFWFYNGMHFPEPMPAFDMITAESCYLSIGRYQGRVFSIPTVLGIEHRVVNGYVYITSNEVTDPSRDRASGSRRSCRGSASTTRTGTRSSTAGSPRSTRAIGSSRRSRCPRLPELEDEHELIHEHRLGPNYRLIAAYDRSLQLYNELNQLHFELLLLAYGAYLTFFQFCQQRVPRHGDADDDADDRRLRHDDVPARRRAEGACRARRSSTASTARSSTAAAARSSSPSSSRPTRDARGSPTSSRASTRGSSCRPATASTTTTARGSTTRACRSRRSRATSRSCRRGRASTGRRSGCSPSATGSRPSTGAPADRRGARAVRRDPRALPPRVPARGGPQVLHRALGHVAVLQQDARDRRGARRAGFFDEPTTSSTSTSTRCTRRSGPRARLVGRAPGARHRVLAADRRAAQGDPREAAEWMPPPALGPAPEVINEPTGACSGASPPSGCARGRASRRRGRQRLRGLAGRRRGPARVVRDVDEIGDRAAGRGARLPGHGAELGAGVPEDRRRRLGHRRDHVPRGDRRPRVRPARRRRHRHATKRIKTGDRVRVDGNTGVVTILA